jgi:hypothetical protein
MAEQSYPYSIASDLPGGAVNNEKLLAEIQASAIVTALDRVDSSGDVLSVVFKATLSSEDKTILDGDATGPAGGLLAAHDNSASPDETQTVALDPTKTHTFELQEESPGSLIYHNFAFPLLTINGGSDEGYTEISLPYDIWFLAIEYWGGPGSGVVFGDKITSEGDPDRNMPTLLGAAGNVLEDAAAGQKEVKAHTAALAAGLIHPGYLLKFGTDTNSYMVVSMDLDTGIVTLDETLVNAVSQGDKIVRTICLGQDLWAFPASVPIEYGQEKMGGSKLSATWAFRISFKAKDTAGRVIQANLMAALKEVTA